jgi:hypothetical protein
MFVTRVSSCNEMETSNRRQSATTRVWGSIGSAEIFAEGTAHTTTKWDVHHAGLARYRAWWAADGAWSACGRVERAAVRQRCPPPAERDCPLAQEVIAALILYTRTTQRSASHRN